MKSLFIKSATAASIALFAGSSASAIDTMEGWKTTLRSKIQSSNMYPVKAIENGIEGTVKVRLKFDRDGDVSGIEFVEKSGHDVLDRRAFATALRISDMPALPEGREDISLVIPVRFKLPDNS